MAGPTEGADSACRDCPSMAVVLACVAVGIVPATDVGDVDVDVVVVGGVDAGTEGVEAVHSPHTAAGRDSCLLRGLAVRSYSRYLV